MRVFLNELALADTWNSTTSVHEPLTAILQARQKQPILRDALYCARGMGGVRTAAGAPLSLAARQLPRDTRIQFFEWVTRHGPFVEDDRQVIDEDLFYFEDDEVTDLGLGEAARRIRAEQRAATLSPIRTDQSRFADDPLSVVQGFPDEPVAQVAIPNFTESERLVEILRTLDPEPDNWHDFLDVCRHRFDSLHIGPHCDDTLAHFPYMPSAARRIVQLLNVLQRIRNEMDPSGRLSARGLEIRNTFFTGDRAWFSDESPGRKQRPKKFTFPDPAGGRDIVCFWHGKVSTAAIRMYFDWPVQRDASRIRVVYIGPHV